MHKVSIVSESLSVGECDVWKRWHLFGGNKYHSFIVSQYWTRLASGQIYRWYIFRKVKNLTERLTHWVAVRLELVMVARSATRGRHVMPLMILLPEWVIHPLIQPPVLWRLCWFTYLFFTYPGASRSASAFLPVITELFRFNPIHINKSQHCNSNSKRKQVLWRRTLLLTWPWCSKFQVKTNYLKDMIQEKLCRKASILIAPVSLYDCTFLPHLYTYHSLFLLPLSYDFSWTSRGKTTQLVEIHLNHDHWL